MKHLETKYKEDPVNVRPLFSSTWVTLFTELRNNYKQRNIAIASPDTTDSEILAKEQSDIQSK